MGNELDLIKEFFDYNTFVRRKYFEKIFKELPEEERYKDRGASFPSLVDIFVHVIDAYRYWLYYMINGKLNEYYSLRGKIKSPDEVEREMLKVEKLIKEFFDGLNEEDLNKVVTYSYKNKKYQRRIKTILLHLIEEELQHRGELNALLWQIDIDPPVIGYDEWMEQKS
jgi:uncharacterized damage-inducible protein DinB